MSRQLRRAQQDKLRAWLTAIHAAPSTSPRPRARGSMPSRLLRQTHPRRLKHGVFHSVVDLQAAINRFIRDYNAKPKAVRLESRSNDIIAARNPEAELYGSALTHSGGHYDYWETMRSRGAAYIRSRGLSMALLQSEYEEWPRGRIVFHTENLRFSLLADRRLHTPERIRLIRDEFHLPKDSFDIHLDGHYIQTTNSSIVEDW